MHAARHRPRFVFGLALALGGAGLTAATAAVIAAAGSVHHAPRSAHEILAFGGRFTYPAVNVAAALLLLLAGLGLIVLLSAALACVRQLRAYRHFVNDVPVLGKLPGHPNVTLIADHSVQAFCAGYLRPRIYISAGAVEKLSPEELDAVLVHEQHHRSARDPLRLACGRILNQALFFLPALSPLSDRYAELAEIHADDTAIRAAAGNRAPLASALLRFDAEAPGGSAGISADRVDSLLGIPSGRPLPVAAIATSVAALTAMIVLIWRASGVASVHATLNLPLLSSQPCVLVLALIPAILCLSLRVAWQTPRDRSRSVARIRA
jgi:Zn-dependent protease with chaperone function